MQRRKILICGATGFIGRNLTERFAGHPEFEVHAVGFQRPPYDCPGVTWHRADLRNVVDVQRIVEAVDIIVHAAATTSGSGDIVTRPFIHVTDNAVMNSLLLRAAYEAKVKHFIFFSCSVMLQSNPTPLKETDWDANAEMVPAYFGAGWTKVYIEKICEFYARLGTTKHTVIRHSNIYGPHDKFDLQRSHVFGATVTKVMTAQDGKLTVWGGGDEARDFLYVDDLVDFVECAIGKQEAPFGLYNCGYGEAVQIKNLVRRVIEKSGRPLTIDYDLSKPTIPTSLCLDCSKAAKELGWRRKTDLDEGITRTIAWWKTNPPSN